MNSDSWCENLKINLVQSYLVIYIIQILKAGTLKLEKTEIRWAKKKNNKCSHSLPSGAGW